MSAQIEIAVTCVHYQQRLCWMLSSLLQQMGECPSILFNVAYLVGDGTPTTRAVCSFFRNEGLNIKETLYTDTEILQYRGLVRNRQLAESDSECMLFADCDMTYHPDFFADLWPKVVKIGDFTQCLSAYRVSLDKAYCRKYFNGLDEHKYPCIIDKAGDLSNWPIYAVWPATGGGYFQMVKVKTMRDKFEGLYIPPSKCNDWSWQRGQMAKSDRKFRERIGGFIPLVTKPQYHLNHERDHEAGGHLTIQR